MRHRWLAWFALNIIGIIPLSRAARGGLDPFKTCVEALDRGNLLLVFPEGSRGEPEVMGPFKRGVAVLAARRPQVPVIPIYLQGLGKALPKGDPVLVPFSCDVFVGEPLAPQAGQALWLETLTGRMQDLARECPQTPWSNSR